jgi:hypothetical protein
LLSFTAVALVLIVVPGPSVLFVIGRPLAYGRRAALGGWDLVLRVGAVQPHESVSETV